MEKLNKIQEYDSKKMIKYCMENEKEELHKLKLYLDDLYYNTGNSELSDKLYDILKKTLIERDPDYIPPVGAKIRTNENRVKLPYWVGSSDKITPDEKNILNRWINKNPCENVVLF